LEVEREILNMKKVNIIFLMGVLFLIIASSTIGSALSYSSTSYSDDFLWMPLLIIGIIIIVYAIWIAVGIWVYKDAKKRGENAVLWLVITIFGGLIGLLIWLAIRPPIGGRKSLPDRMCPNCGRSIPMDAKICPYCGKKFETYQ
jgi:hypothetical protein